MSRREDLGVHADGSSGDTTSGASPCAARTRFRPTFKYVWFAAMSQFANAPMNHKSALRSSTSSVGG